MGHGRDQDGPDRRHLTAYRHRISALTIRTWNAWIVGDTLQPMGLIDSDSTSAGFSRLRCE